MLVSLLALVAAGTGLMWNDGPGTFEFTTVRGETVEIYGRGLYRFDSLLSGAGHRGVDLVTLVVGVPLLLGATLSYHRGSIRGQLLLSGVLTYFLYVYASLTFGAAWNEMFLIYVAIVSAGLYALGSVVYSINPHTFSREFSHRIPRLTIAVFLLVSGLLTLVLWLESPVTALATGQPPALLGSSTTLITHVLDLSIVVPALFLSGVLIMRNRPPGYIVGFPLLVLIAMLAPAVTAMTAGQLFAGIHLSAAEVAGFVVSFTLLGLISTWLVVAILRRVHTGPG